MRSDDLARHSPDDVTNQSPPLENYNLAAGDAPLLEALAREGGTATAQASVLRLGQVLGTASVLSLGDQANAHEPTLKNFDRFGRRIDEVEFHASYHELMALSMREGLHASPWESATPGRYVERAAKYYLKHQVEQGTSCPITMTFAVTASLRSDPAMYAAWKPKLESRLYDAQSAPVGQKTSALFGMGMTERQGGSDVRSNASKAYPMEQSGPGKPYRIDGHKWFCSAPQSDALLVLAQTTEGLSCFLVPRFLQDGQRNAVIVERLKPKLGNRSNASSEIRLRNATGFLLGEEGRGVAVIIEMVRHTRLDCCIGGAALIRRGLSEAIHHCAFRYTFGRRLIEQPLMQNVLADMALESEAATVLMMRLNRAYEEAEYSEEAASFARLATAIAKFQITRKETQVIREALECFGGNGYIEESPMPRLFRESPLNAIWEGSGNVQCLDALRAAQRSPTSMDTLVDELERARGAIPLYDRWLSALPALFKDPTTLELRARTVVESLAIGLQSALMIQHSPSHVAEAFVLSRLGPDRGQAFGTLPQGIDFRSIIARHAPETVARMPA